MIRLGTVPFLNAKPLIYPLEKKIVPNEFCIQYYVPSTLSKKLLENKIDIGLIPVIELFERRRYKVIPNISISSKGKVDSVALVVKGDVSDITSVAVDERSQTSTALLRIILEIFYGLSPEYVKRSYENNFFRGVDAGMVIGDSGLKLCYESPKRRKTIDLGEVWTEYTGLPLVYAVFAVREGVNLGCNGSSLLLAKLRGMEFVDKIALFGARKLGVSVKFCTNYLRNRIRYDLGEEEIKGLLKYNEFLSELGICSKIENINFY